MHKYILGLMFVAIIAMTFVTGNRGLVDQLFVLEKDKDTNTQIVILKRGNQQIMLVGARHYATKKYYHKLQSVLDTCSEVLYEGLDMEENTVVHGDPDKIKKRDLSHDEEGLAFQGEEMKVRGNWIWSDLRASDMAQILGRKNWFPYVEENFNTDKVYHAIIIMRNNRVILDAIKALKRSDHIAIFYGNMHSKHFIEQFETMGFKVVREEDVSWKQ